MDNLKGMESRLMTHIDRTYGQQSTQINRQAEEIRNLHDIIRSVERHIRTIFVAIIIGIAAMIITVMSK